MSEEAERIAIEFGIWLTLGYDVHGSVTDRWLMYDGGDEAGTTSDLFEIFKKEKGYV